MNKKTIAIIVAALAVKLAIDHAAYKEQERRMVEAIRFIGRLRV